MAILTGAEEDELAIYRHLAAVGLNQQFTTHLGELANILKLDRRRVDAALRRLARSGAIKLVKYLGDAGHGPQYFTLLRGEDAETLSNSNFRVQVTPQGEAYFEQLCLRAPEGDLIFISCGQYTDEEWGLGCTVERLIRERTGREAFFAQNESSLEGVSKRFRRAESRRWVRRHNASQGSRFHPRGRAYSGIRLG